MDKQSKLNLWTFLQERGCSLTQFGSSEFGLNVLDAIEFVGLIEGVGLSVLGIEKWTKSKDGYSLDGLDGWISDDNVNSESSNATARAYLTECLKGPPALYTIQF